MIQRQVSTTHYKNKVYGLFALDFMDTTFRAMLCWIVIYIIGFICVILWLPSLGHSWKLIDLILCKLSQDEGNGWIDYWVVSPWSDNVM